jgi:RNA-directed DNA polymerase
LGNLATPKSVQKLQTALHAKAKAEAGYRFYALYDKISRDDILAHAYAQCRSNTGAPGIDGQDFAEIEAYGVERWLAELALALRQDTYRPEPIRRAFIPKANGKLRPLGISSVRDRVCMTATLLVLEPIFEADLPPEIYAYRAGRNAQQAVVAVEEVLFRGHPDVVDARERGIEKTDELRRLKKARNRKMLWGGRRGDGNFVAASNRWSASDAPAERLEQVPRGPGPK